MIGAGARKLIERGLEVDGRHVGPGDLDRLTNDFIDHYAAHIADESRPFEGLEDALDDLAARGCRFAVCTNKLEWLSKLLLDELGLSSRFSAICGADTFGVSKPDPAILQQTVARAGGRLASTIMVGDAGTGYRRRPPRQCAGGRRRLRLYRRADGGPQARPSDRPYEDLPAAVESLLAERRALAKLLIYLSIIMLASGDGINHQLTIPARMVAWLSGRSYGRAGGCGS